MNEDVLKKIVENYDAPTYIFDIQALKDRIKFLKNRLPSKLQICYAIKANTFIVEDIVNDVERFEVCSPGEYEICKSKNIDRSKIVISGVYKTPNLIKEMVSNDKNINCYTIESMEQFELFKNIQTDHKIKLLIRLTSGNQFGIDEKEVQEIIKNRE